MLAGLKPVPVYRLREPQFAVAWETRRRNFAGSLLAVLRGPKPPKKFDGGAYFCDCAVGASAVWFAGARKPKRALLLSVLWHIVLFTSPFPIWKAASPQTQLTLPQIEITWYGPPQDLPQISAPGRVPKPSPLGEPRKPLPPRGADAFHPRQTIISAPRVPTHPRQTLIRPDAPPVPPKILPQLPNMVLWAESSQPARPRLQIDRAALARLRPRKRVMRPLPEMPVPQVPNLEKRAGELNLASSAANVPKPQLPRTPTSVPRAGPRQSVEDAGPAPDIRPDADAGEAGVQRLVAISATPAASGMNLPLPEGNLAARVFISPEGAQAGVPGGSPRGMPGVTGAAGGGPDSPGGTGGAGGAHPGNGARPRGVSISGGNQNATSVISGVGADSSSRSRGTNAASTRARASKLSAAAADPGRTAPAPGFERSKPGAPPEEVFAPRRIYTLHVNMPNLASVTGSWVLSFVETNGPETAEGGGASSAADLNGPVPLRKVDPKYPPALMHAKVEGEVVLYAIIRRDGSVDSIQLVKGIEPELDTNAMEALARWKFRPAQRKGSPVELEAIVRIPFHAVLPLY